MWVSLQEKNCTAPAVFGARASQSRVRSVVISQWQTPQQHIFSSIYLVGASARRKPELGPVDSCHKEFIHLCVLLCFRYQLCHLLQTQIHLLGLWRFALALRNRGYHPLVRFEALPICKL